MIREKTLAWIRSMELHIKNSPVKTNVISAFDMRRLRKYIIEDYHSSEDKMKVLCSCGKEWTKIAKEGMDQKTLKELQEAIKHLRLNPTHFLKGSSEGGNVDATA